MADVVEGDKGLKQKTKKIKRKRKLIRCTSNNYYNEATAEK